MKTSITFLAACLLGFGFASGNPTSFNDTWLYDESVPPCETETCNGIDDDCDDLIDEGFVGNPAALHFDGSNDYIHVGNWWNFQDFTIQMWLKPGATQVIYTDIIDNNHASGVRWVCQQNGTNTNEYSFGIALTGGTVGNVFTLTANVWQHLTIVKNATNTKIYLDGVLTGTTPCSGTIIGGGTGQDNVLIGNWNGGGRNWNGEMDEIRLWNYARSASEIEGDLHCELTGNESGLVAYYTLNEGIPGGNNSSISYLPDHSGSNHHGGLVGFNLSGSGSNFTTGTESVSYCGLWYADADGDGYGDPNASTPFNCALTGHVQNGDDCDDTSNSIYPGTTDQCNELDDNCNLIVDEDNGMHFDGINDYISLPAFNYSAFNAMTIEAWIKPQNISSNPYYEISRQNAGGGPDWLFSFQDFGTILSFGLATTSGYSELDVPIVASDFVNGEWHHVAAVYDGATRKVYKDGVLIGTDGKSGNIVFSPSAGNYIGRYPLGSEYFYGVMDEVYFWTIARTGSELLEDMEMAPAPQSELLARYSFNIGVAGGDNTALMQVHDASGNGYHGAPVSFAKTGSTSNWVTGINSNTWYVDLDEDGYGNPEVVISSCIQPEGYVAVADDCNDSDPLISPEAVEVCNGSDDDCDGITDEGFINVEEGLHFDGSNDYINVGNWWNYEQFTVQMWLKPGSTQVTYADIIDNNHSSVRWVCQQNAGITNQYAFGIATTGGNSGVPFSLIANVWQHLTLVKSATSIEVYINGILTGSAPCSGTIVGGGAGDNIFIGNWNSGGRNWRGSMDEIRLWNYALNQTQVQADLYCELTGTESGLVAYYKLNQGMAGGNNAGITTAIDATANAHHGSLVGFNLTGSTSNFVIGADNLGNCGVLYADDDGDGYGNPMITIEASCSAPGYVQNSDDCDDANAYIHPGASEICNLIDEDCDGYIDEGAQMIFYADTDNDGFGNADATLLSCSLPPGYVNDNTDCDDTDMNIHPGALEVCNGVDDNCNDSIDEGFEYSTAPTSLVSSDGNTFCLGGSTTLSVVGGALGTDAQWVWYEAGCGNGTPLGAGSELLITPSAGVHHYYVRAEGTCNSTECASISIEAYASPAFPVCPGGISEGNLFTFCHGIVNYSVNATGSPAPTLSYFFSGATEGSGSGTGSGSIFNIGSTSVTITAENLCGTAECSFDITVEDTEGPDFNGCPDNITAAVEIGQWGAHASWSPPTATDNCALLSITSSHEPGDFFNAGNTLVIYTAEDINGNVTYCQFTISITPPDLVGTVNVSVFVTDILFSNDNPQPNSTVNVSAIVRNTSFVNAESFEVKLVDLYSGTTYASRTISFLPKNQSAQVNWIINTPAVAAFVPIQITLDHLNVLDESNEFDNVAVKPYVCGTLEDLGTMGLESSATPPSTLAGDLIQICGHAEYDVTPPLDDPSVAGASIVITITETGQAFEGYTDEQGNFCITYRTPSTPGLYHYTVEISDNTLSGDITGTFSTTAPPPGTCNRDLFAAISLSGLPNVDGAYTANVGSEFSGTVSVYNNCLEVSQPTTLYVNLTIGTPVPGIFTIPALLPFEQYTVELPMMTLDEVGSGYISATVDYYSEVSEYSETNNTTSQIITSLPLLPDLVIVKGEVLSEKKCEALNQAVFTVANKGTVASGQFTAVFELYEADVLVFTQTDVLASLDPDRVVLLPYYFTPTELNILVRLRIDFPDVISEIHESNNEKVVPAGLQECESDLIVEDCSFLTIDPANPLPNDLLTITAYVSNYGKLTVTDPFDVQFNVDGTLLSVPVTTTLGQGAAVPVIVSIPAPMLPGSLIITADVTNVIAEQTESNNSYTASLCYDFELTNAGCSDFIFSSTHFICQSRVFEVGVINHGAYAADNVEVFFEISGPGLSGWVDLGTASRYMNTTCLCPQTVALPNSFFFPQTGTYQVRMTVDPQDVYAECNETDNTFEISVNVGESVEYEVLSEYITPSDLNPDINEPVSFNVSYTNNGCNGFNSVELHASVDDIPLDSVMAPPISTGGFGAVEIPNFWSSSTPGLHVFRAIIDYDQQMPEADENNNEATRGIFVGDAPDYRIVNVSASDMTPDFGTLITLTCEVHNDGLSSGSGTFQLILRDASNQEIVLHEETINLASGSTDIQLIEWIVSDPFATVIARVSNVIPQESDFSDNEMELQLNALSLTIIEDDVLCSGLDLGSLEVIISGGREPYSVMWNNGLATNLIQVPSGTYNVLVVDANGSIAMASDTVEDLAIPNTWYADADGDGFGDSETTLYTCDPPSGYVGTGTDCNDAVATAYPGATEFPDGVDNDCDGSVDEGVSSLSVDAGDCESVYLGFEPEECISLSVNVDGGTSPYTYAWSNGGVGSTTTVCPDETTIYTIVVTDQNGFTAQDEVTVQVIDVRCGNNNEKVNVCHIPPGNPENAHTICISINALDVHLEEHGDYIGVCGTVDPCLDDDEEMMSESVIPHDAEVNPVLHITTDSVDGDQELTVSLIPNPADAYVSIRLIGVSDEYHISLFDASGKLLQANEGNREAIRLSTAELENGMYYIRIQSEKTSITKGLVIVHN